MKPEEIRAIALEVAKEMGFRCVEDYILFATRFLAAINAKAEPVAEVHGDPDYVHTWQVYPIKRGSYKPGDKLFLHPAIEPALSAARSLTDELMDCVDRLGSEYDTVDPRVWEHILVYAKPVGAAPLPCGRCNGSGWVVRDPDIGTDQECFVCEGRGVIEGAPVTLPDDVRPQDLKIDCMFTQLGGGFAPILNNGIRVTHLPTGIVIEETGARSQHRNRAIAIERLKNELANLKAEREKLMKVVEAAKNLNWTECSSELNAALKGLEK